MNQIALRRGGYKSVSLKYTIKPRSHEQFFYDKFPFDKYFLLMSTRSNDNFFYDKCICSKYGTLAFICHRKNCHMKYLLL